MDNYQIKLRRDQINANTKLTEIIYGGWVAQNIGNVDVEVYGFTLVPGAILSSQQFINTRPGDLWQEPIVIDVKSGGEVLVLRSICQKL